MYCSLHNHTAQGSNVKFLDSINRPEDMVTYALELGYKGMAFTDHECLSAAVSIIKVRDQVQKEHPDFKFIFGNEIYLIDETEVHNTDNFFHFILLAKDLEGWKQLRTLSSRAWDRSYMYKGILRTPTTYQDIEEVIGSNPGHIIASSACIGGELGVTILNHNKERLNKFVNWCIKIFSKDNFYIELQPALYEEQQLVNKVLINLSKFFGLKYIFTTDSHYLKKDDMLLHSVFLNSKQSKDRETEKFYKYTYLMSIEEITENLKQNGLSDSMINAGFDATMEIYNKIENYDFRHSTIVPAPFLPQFEVIHLFKNYYDKYPFIKKFAYSNVDQDRYLLYQIEQGFITKKQELCDLRVERINIELDIIDYISNRLHQSLSAYLNLTVDMVNTAWQVSLVGCGRGCFTPGQKVQLSDGTFENIEKVQKGTKVLTHLGNYKEVYGTLNYDVNETLYKITGIGRETITCTNNHKFWGIKNSICNASSSKNQYCNKFCKRNKNCQYKQFHDSCEWIEAQDLKVGDYITVPKNHFLETKTSVIDLSDYVPNITIINNDYIYYRNEENKYLGYDEQYIINRYINISPDFCRLIGYFIGNGYTVINEKTNNYKVSISFNKAHKEKIEDCVNIIKGFYKGTINIKEHTTKQVVSITIYNKCYAYIFNKLCGELAQNKHVPVFIFENKDRVVQCLKGLMLTDGSISIEEHSAKYSTISSELYYQVNFMFSLINIYSRMYTSTKKKNNWKPELINKITSADFDVMMQTLFPEVKMAKQIYYSNRVKQDETYFYIPVTKIETLEYRGKVYDISVMDDTSYTINGVAVHNSACGFYVNYLIGATQVDPIKYNLPYWRFANKERLDLFDIDEDYQPEKTEEIIQLLRDKYGKDNVLNCATFKTESLKSAVLTSCRGRGINNDEAQAMALMVPQHRGKTYTLQQCEFGDEEQGFDPVPEFINKLKSYEGLYETVKMIEGLSTNCSIHASALYVFNNSYLEYNSLMKAPNGTRITAFNMHDSDDLGALKMDVLRTDAQSKMAKCLSLLLKDNQIEWQGSLRATYDKYLHPDVLDYDSSDMWHKAWNGEIEQLFQFETQVGGVCIKKSRPTNVLELAEINSIMRLQSESGEQPIDRYVRFRNDPEQWYQEMRDNGLNEHEISILEKYLKKSYGVSGSQEVLMQILMDPEVCGFTLREANDARKAIAKKQTKKLIQLKKDFFEKGSLTPGSDNKIVELDF